MKTIAKTALILTTSLLLSGAAFAEDSCSGSEVIVSNVSTHTISVSIKTDKGSVNGSTSFELQPNTNKMVTVNPEDMGWKGYEASGTVTVKPVPGADEYDKGRYEFDDHKMPYCTNGSKVETNDDATVHMSLETGHNNGKDRATFEISDK